MSRVDTYHILMRQSSRYVIVFGFYDILNYGRLLLVLSETRKENNKVFHLVILNDN
jgi:hypothetical protein